MRLGRKQLVIGIVMVAVIVIAVMLVRQRTVGKSGEAFRTAIVERGDISVIVTATGTLNPLKTVQVGSQISGTIAELHADFNSRVSRGQLIALIDTTFLAASVKEAEAVVERSGAQLKQTEMELERARILAKKQLVSQLECEIAATAYESALATLKSAEAQLERAKVNLTHASIRAPADGIVISRNVDVGQTVAASFAAPTLFLIAHDLGEMQLEANIDEGDIGMIREGQRVTFTVNAYAEEVFEGVVSQVRLEPITVQDVVSYMIIVAVSNPEEKLMPGMTATLSVHIDRREDVLKVPNAALRFKPSGLPPDMILREASGPHSRDPSGTRPQQPSQEAVADRKVVWRLTERGRIEPVRVKAGLTDGSCTEVRSAGLAEGDVVVTALSKQGSRTQTRTQTNPFQPTRPRGHRRGP